MFDSLTVSDRASENRHSMTQSPWGSARVGKRLDTELATQLRIMLSVDFEQATSWGGLRRALREKGFSLQRVKGRLRVLDSISRVDICSTGFLGYPTSQLEHSFGTPFENAVLSGQMIG